MTLLDGSLHVSLVGPFKLKEKFSVAAKDGLQNDYSVGTTWLLQDKNYYLIGLVRDRLNFPRLRDAAKALSDRYQP